MKSFEKYDDLHYQSQISATNYSSTKNISDAHCNQQSQQKLHV